jgi:diguanylate cyclase (GGDEF)-like protein
MNIEKRSSEHQEQFSTTMILQKGEAIMHAVFGKEPEIQKTGTKKSESHIYWNLFRQLVDAEPRYLNYIEQFISIVEQMFSWQEVNENRFLHAFEKALSATRQKIEWELQESIALEKLTKEEREDLLRRFLQSPTVQNVLRRIHKKRVFHPSQKEYIKEVLHRLVATKEGLKDPLTGMLNKRALLQIEGPREITRSIRQTISEISHVNMNIRTEQLNEILEQKACSFMMLDLDHFKVINDTYGHPVGDNILKQVAQTICSIRGSDIVTRYGGEEFFIILPDTSCKEAFNVAERIRKKIQDIPYVSKTYKPISLTVSIGVVGLSSLPSWKPALLDLINREHLRDNEQHQENFRKYSTHLIEEAVIAADTALYWAKRKGRNTVEMWSPTTDLLFQQFNQQGE